MSEVQDQTESIQDLARALVEARTELAAAEKAAKDYADAVVAGTKQITLAEAAQIEAQRAVAKAHQDAAQAALRAEADGTAASQRAAKASADQAKAAMEAARATEAAERKKAQAVEEAAARTSKLKELSVGALGGEETVEKYNKAREALKLAGNESLSVGQRFAAGAVAAKFAAGAVGALATKAIEFAADAREAAAETERYQQRLAALGGAYDNIRAATAGAMDSQVAFNLQFAIADAGVAQADSHLAALSRAVREHARTRQVTQEQASSVVQRAIGGDAAAAAQLGINLNGVTDAAARQRAVLDGLVRQQQGQTVATRDATEEARSQEQAWTSLGNGLKKVGAAALYPLLSTIEDINRAQHSWTVTQAESARATDAAGQAAQQQTAQLERTASVLRQQRDLQRQVAQDAQRDASVQLQAGQAELARYNVVIQALGQRMSAEDQLRLAIMNAHDIERRAGEEAPAFEQRRLKAQQDLLAAIRRKNDEQARRDGEVQAQRDLGLLAHTIRAHGGVVDARIKSIGPAQLYRDIQREIAGFAQRENEDTTQAAERFARLMQQGESARQQMNQEARDAFALRENQRELNNLQREAQSIGLKVAGTWDRQGFHARVAAEAGESAADTVARQRDIQRDLNQLVLDGIQDSERQVNLLAQMAENVRRVEEKERDLAAVERERQLAMEEADTAKFRSLAEQTNEQRARADERRRNLEDAQDMERQLRSAFGFAEDLQEQSQTATQSMAKGAKEAADGFAELGKGMLDAAVSAAKSGDDAGAAIAKQVDDWAAAKALQWGMQAIESFAGAGMAYFIRPDAVPGLLTAGAMYTGLAAVAGITTAAIPNAPASSSAGGGNTGAMGPAGLRNESSANAREQPAIVFNVSGVMANEQTQEVLVGALRDAQGRGILQLGL